MKKMISCFLICSISISLAAAAADCNELNKDSCIEKKEENTYVRKKPKIITATKSVNKTYKKEYKTAVPKIVNKKTGEADYIFVKSKQRDNFKEIEKFFGPEHKRKPSKDEIKDNLYMESGEE